jgi:hypothetical protein
MSVPVLADPGPERATGPRSRALHTCPTIPAAAEHGTAPTTGPAARRPTGSHPGAPTSTLTARDAPTGPSASGESVLERGDPARPTTPARALDAGAEPRLGVRVAAVALGVVVALVDLLLALGRALVERACRDDRGMSTVEYAIGTLAAAAFAAVLYAVVSGDSVVTALTGLVQRALQVAF